MTKGVIQRKRKRRKTKAPIHRVAQVLAIQMEIRMKKAGARKDIRTNKLSRSSYLTGMTI